MYKLIKHLFSQGTYLLLLGGLGPRPSCSILLHHLHRLSLFDGPHGSGHPDPDFR